MPSPTPAERRRQHRADVRQSILDAADELLAEAGVGGFSMRGLAARCGCTAPTIYHYFRDKAHLIESAVEARLEQFVRELNSLPRSDDPVAMLRSIGAAVAHFGLRHPSHYQLLIVEGRDTESPSRAELIRIALASLQDLVRRGDLHQEDLEMLRQGLWSLIHGFILLQRSRPDEEWEPDLLDHSLDALIRGSLRSGRAASRKPASRADLRARS
jgi:AcrR family transcriptional regulator